MSTRNKKVIFYGDISDNLNVNLGNPFHEAMEVPKVKSADENWKICVDTSCVYSHASASALNERIVKRIISPIIMLQCLNLQHWIKKMLLWTLISIFWTIGGNWVMGTIKYFTLAFWQKQKLLTNSHSCNYAITTIQFKSLKITLVSIS